MRRVRATALILLAEIAAQAELPVPTRIAIGMSRDCLLALDEVEPVGRLTPSHQDAATTADVVRLLEHGLEVDNKETARLRVAARLLGGHSMP